MMAVLGSGHLLDDLHIFKALNPVYAIELLTMYPKGFWILGAVFLCTTGAEALYSDLGHCGKSNIRISWIYVKTCLILNYLGQGAWLLHNQAGKVFDTAHNSVFYQYYAGLVPDSGHSDRDGCRHHCEPGPHQRIFYADQRKPCGLNLWPKFRISYPTEQKGQLYIPAINFLLFIGCCGITIYFRSSSHMEAAYGLAITLCMLATSILFSNYLISRRAPILLIYLYLSVYLIIEFSFLFANLEKFPHGGFVTLIVGGGLFGIMYVWYRSRKIKNRYVEFVRLENYIPQIQELSTDRTVPKFATHLMYMTSANNPKEIEHKIIYSILNKKPKRADIYWFVHIDTLDEPYISEYSVDSYHSQ